MPAAEPKTDENDDATTQNNSSGCDDAASDTSQVKRVLRPIRRAWSAAVFARNWVLEGAEETNGTVRMEGLR
ncbi:hypothetical protein HDU67_004147, partial [Dinochytrium kinnereticum]